MVNRIESLCKNCLYEWTGPSIGTTACRKWVLSHSGAGWKRAEQEVPPDCRLFLEHLVLGQQKEKP